MGHEVRSKLYVVAVAGTDPQQVAAVLDAAGAATLLIAGRDGSALTAVEARPLVELAQAKEIAALIAGDAAARAHVARRRRASAVE